MGEGQRAIRRRDSGDVANGPPPPGLDQAERGPNRLALAGLCLSSLLASLGASAANVALPTLAGSFDASFQAIQWVLLSYLLAGTILMPGIGRLGDRYERRRALIAGIFLFTAASALCAGAPTLWTLIAARALQGLGAAVMLALALALAVGTVPRAKAGGAMGLLGAMSAAGTAIGPSLGGLLIAAAGWRAIFLLCVPIGLAALLLARFLPEEDRESRRTSAGFDIRGTIILAFALASFTLALTLGHGRFGTLNLALGLAASVGAALFVFAQKRTKAPLISPALLRLPGLKAGLAASGLVSTVMMATLVVGPFYLARALRFGPAAVGLALSAGPLGAALAGLPAGKAVDRFGTSGTAVFALLAMAIACALLAALPATLGPAAYVASILLLTGAYALFQAANNKQIMVSAPAGESGMVSSMLNLSRSLGLISGTAAMGALFALASGAAELAEATPGSIAHGMHVTFGVGALLIVLAVTLIGRDGIARSLAACKTALTLSMLART